MNAKIVNQQKLYSQCEQFVLGVYKTFDSHPQKLKSFINLFNRNGRANNQLLESQMQLVDLIQEYPDLVERLNALVPEDFKVPLLESQNAVAQDENIDIDIQSAIKELQTRHPEKVDNLIEIIRDIQDIKDNKSDPNIDGPKEKLRLLLQEDEPNLYNMFIKYLKSIFDETTLNKDEEMEPINEMSNPISVRMETEEKEEFRPRGVGVGRGGFERKFRGGKRPLLRDRNALQPATSTFEKIDATTLPPTIRNELYLFEYLRSNLSSEDYNELAKILYLYTEYVISAHEVYLMSKPLFYENENYFSFFCDIISARETARRKNCNQLVKPLSEVDFKKLGCERIKSYTKIPPSFTHMKRPPHPKNPIAFKVLNRTWISVSQGSEVNFKINAKNQYEEALLKCEEERYEFDTVIYNCTTAIKWLNDLENQTGEEKLNNKVDKILRLKVIQKVYGNNVDIIEIFRKSPLNIAKILAERLQTKLKEIKETKFNQARRKWHETAQENFHRSLDHRSLYFKQYEKKLTYHKTFNTDALTRFNELNITGNTKYIKKYWSILNTFEGVSNGVLCKHEEPNNEMLFNLIKKNPFPRRNLPVFRMTFANKMISQDIFDILTLKVQNFHANLTEKDKISRCLKAFMLELLRFPYEQGRSRDIVFEPKTLLEIASRIEQKIYVESFNFNASKTDETDNKNADETIYTAIERARQGSKDGDKRRDIDGDGPNKDYTLNSNQGFSRRMDEELAVKKNPTESLDDDLGFDSGSEDQNNIREMEYSTKDDAKINSEFVPKQEKGQIMFYGTQHIYYLVRFYFTLYERFLKAYEISQEFEMNSKTAVLSPEEKSRLAQERYEIFKWILVHLIRQNIDVSKYEDFLRSVFGNRAYLMYFIDKILHLIIITIQKMINDDISLKTLNLYPEADLFGKGFENNQRTSSNKPKNWVENVYIAQLNNLTIKNIACLQATNFFRFLYDPQTCAMTINLYNSPYKDWNDKVLESISNTQQAFLNTSYDETVLRGSLNNIYLRRAKEKNRKKTVRTLIKIVQSNNIEWKYIPNTIKLVTDSFHEEDFLWIVKRKAPPSKEIIKKVSSRLKSLNRFRDWHKNALQNMNAKLP